MKVKPIFLIAQCFGPILCSAGEVTIPHSFTADTPTKAAEANINFNAISVGLHTLGCEIGYDVIP